MVESERRSKLRIAGWLRLLGDASYSIYLVHFFALSLLAKIFWACGAARIIPPMIAYLLLASLAVAAGTLCHLIIERPLLALTRRKAAPVHPVRVR
jgi:peptidoglycan/LPS O-acetylase OafA/YrhL